MSRLLRVSTLLDVVAEAAPALATGAPLAALNLLVPRSGYEVHEGIPYGRHPRQNLDVYVPTDLAQPAKVVVFFYGGSWRYGDRVGYRFAGEALASRGFVAVIPDYRLYPEVRFPAFIGDGTRAARWVIERIAAYGGNPNVIFLMGHSTGAYNAAMFALDWRYLAEQGLAPTIIRGMVGLARPHAFDLLAYESTRPIFASATDSDAARPITFVDGKSPPMLLLHGKRDGIVYPVNSDALADRIREAGGSAELVECSDFGHVGLLLAFAKPFRGAASVLDDVAAFIATH